MTKSAAQRDHVRRVQAEATNADEPLEHQKRLVVALLHMPADDQTLHRPELGLPLCLPLLP